ncbi:MAG: hypothetical protein ACOH5I_25330 [Oligoflexus sp.]
MKKQIRKFFREFKEIAAKLVLELGMTRTKVAEDMGFNLKPDKQLGSRISCQG